MRILVYAITQNLICVSHIIWFNMIARIFRNVIIHTLNVDWFVSAYTDTDQLMWQLPDRNHFYKSEFNHPHSAIDATTLDLSFFIATIASPVSLNGTHCATVDTRTYILLTVYSHHFIMWSEASDTFTHVAFPGDSGELTVLLSVASS